MSDKVEIPKQIFIKLKDSFEENEKYEKLELDSKKIFNLRRKIKQLKIEEGYENNILRTITLYSHTQDKDLKKYIAKIYLEHFPESQES